MTELYFSTVKILAQRPTHISAERERERERDRDRDRDRDSDRQRQTETDRQTDRNRDGNDKQYFISISVLFSTIRLMYVSLRSAIEYLHLSKPSLNLV